MEFESPAFISSRSGGSQMKLCKTRLMMTTPFGSLEADRSPLDQFPTEAKFVAARNQ
jgi:hypothetical protein